MTKGVIAAILLSLMLLCPVSRAAAQQRTHIDDYLQYAPTVAFIGLYLAGVEGKHSFRDCILVRATSTLVLYAITGGLKYTIDERRPDGSDYHSFPSGHAARVFAGAEHIRREFGTKYAIGAYAVALGVGFLRVYNERHWAHDVIAGAGIGILSANIGYWMLPVYKRWFKLEDSTVAVLPFYTPTTKSAGLAMSVVF